MDNESSSDSGSESEGSVELFQAPRTRLLTNNPKIAEKLVENKVVSTVKIVSADVGTENKSFLEMGLDGWLCKTLQTLSIKIPTPVQQHCIPAILQGQNVLARSETGSGKTAAFVLPILQTLSDDPYGIYAVILTPTRELAMQINDQIVAFGSSMRVRSCVVIGGEGAVKQATQLEKRPHFVVATPGRFLAQITSTRPPFLKYLRYLVLDEADRLLSSDFADVTNKILSCDSMKSTKKRQTLLFSATMSSSISKLKQLASGNGTKSTFEFQLQEETTVGTVDERFVLCPKHVKHCYFIYLMQLLAPQNVIDESSLKERMIGRKKRKRPAKIVFAEESDSASEDEDENKNEESDSASEDEDSDSESNEAEEEVQRAMQLQRATQMIVFASTCEMCELLLESLRQLGFGSNSVVSIHSGLDQPRRNAALGKFKSGLSVILVATDVAARGLDIPKVDLVLNYDFPRHAEGYVHRAGRTARAGRLGRVVTIVTELDVKNKKVEMVEEFTGKRMKALEGIEEEDALVLMTRASNALQKARMEIDRTERGADGAKNKKKRKR